MMIDAICALSSRRRFITQVSLGIAGTSMLAACGGAMTSLLPSKPQTGPQLAFSDTPQFQELLLQNGLLAVRQQGAFVIRNDMKNNAALVKHASRPFIHLCNCGGGGGGDDDGFSVTYDGISIGSVTTAYVNGTDWDMGNYIDQNAQDDYIDTLFAINQPSVTYGPVYTLSFNDVQCIKSEAQTILAAAGAFATYIQNLIKIGSANPAVRAMFADYSAGELTASEFCMSALAVLGVSACAEAFADVGLALTVAALIWAIWDFAKCATSS